MSRRLLLPNTYKEPFKPLGLYSESAAFVQRVGPVIGHAEHAAAERCGTLQQEYQASGV
jgi:hypothetical protein